MVQGWSAERIAWLRERAAAGGFALAGVAPVEQQTEREVEDSRRITAWLDAGYAGEMEYLKRRDEQDRLLRSSVQVPAPWARSVVLCALNYFNSGPLSIEVADAGAGWIGRYAWSGRAETARDGVEDRSTMVATDYHDVLLHRLRQLETEIQAELPCQSRCYVDTGPIVERAIGARAGVGWIGKNTTVINQEVGSWTLLASILTSLPVVVSAVAAPVADRCGSCTRCLEACPTDALIAPRLMDAQRCIAYLTIEKKGIISPELREGMGRQIFGCDICQDVCPWNRRAPAAQDKDLMPRTQLINPDLEMLAALEPAEFRQLFRGSPMERTGRKRLQRNIAIAMGNSGQQRFRERLNAWASADDPVLAEAARWALGRLAKAASPAINETLAPPESCHEAGLLASCKPAQPNVRALEPMSSVTPNRSTTVDGGSRVGADHGDKPLPLTVSATDFSGDDLWSRLGLLGRYLLRTEVHTYAFSVAANAILALFPFIVLLLTLSRVLFHSPRIQPVVADLMKSFLPTGQDFVMRNMQLLAHPRKGMQIFSLLMLLVSSTGVFLPLEVALNHVWGVRENRSYLHNQIVSLGLAFAVGALAMISVMLSAGQQSVLWLIFLGHTQNRTFEIISHSFMHVAAGLASILLFFLIYWVLPNRKVPALAVLPTAVAIGLLWEFAKVLYVRALPWLDFQAVYGPFYISVGLMMWAFLSGLLLLAGAHFSATRYTLRLARRAAEEDAAEKKDDAA